MACPGGNRFQDPHIFFVPARALQFCGCNAILSISARRRRRVNDLHAACGEEFIQIADADIGANHHRAAHALHVKDFKMDLRGRPRSIGLKGRPLGNCGSIGWSE